MGEEEEGTKPEQTEKSWLKERLRLIRTDDAPALGLDGPSAACGHWVTSEGDGLGIGVLGCSC